MRGHSPHRTVGGRCNGADVILSNGEVMPCSEGLPARPSTGPVVLDPWQDPAHWPDAPARLCPMYHGDACEGVHR